MPRLQSPKALLNCWHWVGRVSARGARRQSAAEFLWTITQSDSWRHCASAAPGGESTVSGSPQQSKPKQRDFGNLRISLHELGMVTAFSGCGGWSGKLWRATRDGDRNSNLQNAAESHRWGALVAGPNGCAKVQEHRAQSGLCTGTYTAPGLFRVSGVRQFHWFRSLFLFFLLFLVLNIDITARAPRYC